MLLATIGIMFVVEVLILFLDFFSSQPNMSTKFHSFVMVFASNEPLLIPESLANTRVIPTAPLSATGLDMSITSSRTKSTRTKKKDMKDSDRCHVVSMKSMQHKDTNT